MQSSVSQIERVCEYLKENLQNDSNLSDRFPIDQNNLFDALHDGVLLCFLMNKLSQKKPGPIPQNDIKMTKALVFHKLANAKMAIDGAEKIGINVTNINSEFIVEKRQNVVLGFLHQIMNNYKIKKYESGKEVEKPQQKPYQPPKQEQKPQQKHQQKPQQKAQQQPPQQQKISAYEEMFHKYSKLSINQNQYIDPSSNNFQPYENVVGPQVVVLYGSLRQASVHRGMIVFLKEVKSQPFFENIHFHEPDLNSLPLFNLDFQRNGSIPNSVKSLRDIVSKSLGLLIAEPENNGALSAAIKNTLDWLSRNYNNEEPLKNKKIGVLSASYLTQNQIQDIQDIAKLTNSLVYKHSFYASLKTGPFDQNTGSLVSEEERDRLAYWYQGYSAFTMSGLPDPEDVGFVL